MIYFKYFDRFQAFIVNDINVKPNSTLYRLNYSRFLTFSYAAVGSKKWV